uniref:Uncharacterized protein n=1 Tax=Moniliophthora roreri TaxID=221103 RepID=A0A0W0F4E3_MONRR
MFLLVSCLSLVTSALGYTWPSPFDDIEGVLYLQNGYDSRGFRTIIVGCAGNKFRQTSAEWLRAAFRDMAGTGVDVRYELTRPEHIGVAGTGDSIQHFSASQSPKTSLADLVVSGVYALCLGSGMRWSSIAV